MATLTPNTGSLIFGSDQSVTGLAGSLAMTGLAAVLALGTILTPVTGSAAVTGAAPTVTESSTDYPITPTVGSLTITGIEPELIPSVSAYPDTGALAVTGIAPDVLAPIDVTPTAGALTVTGLSATIGVAGTVTPGTGTAYFGLASDITPAHAQLALSGIAPVVSLTGASSQIQPTTGTLTLAPNAPAFSTLITPSTADPLKVMQWAELSWTANTEPDLAGYFVYRGSTAGNPTESRNANNVTTYVWNDLPYGTSYFSISSYDTSSNESARSSEVSVDISGGGWAPVVQGGIPPTTGTLALNGLQPSVVETAAGNTSISPFTGQVAFSGVLAVIAPAPASATLSLTGAAPTVSLNVQQSIVPEVGSLTITGLASWTNTGTIPSVGSLDLTAQAPTARGPVSVRPTAGSLTVTGIAGSVPGLQITPGTGSLSIRGGYETPYPCAGNWGTFTWGGVNWCSDRRPQTYEAQALDYLVHHLSVEITQTGSTDWVLDRITPILNINAQIPDTYQAAVDRHNIERMSVEVLCTSRDDFALYTIRPVMNLRKKWRDS